MIILRNTTIIFLRLLTLITLVFLCGCQSPIVQTTTPTSPVPKLSTQEPSLRGTIINIYTSDNKINGFYAEGKKEPSIAYDKARIIITDKTKIFYKTNGEFTLTNRDALIIGLVVEVLFEGPIEESDPIRATAGEIVIQK